MPPVQRRSETKKENRLHTPHALTITPVTVSDGVHVERTAQGTRIPDARREHDGRNHHHRRLLAPRPADGMEHVRRRGTRRPAYGRNPPYPQRISAGPPTPATRDAVVVLYAQWTDAMTTMPETGGTMNEHYLLKTIGGGLPLRPHPHPIRAAAHAPKPVASTGRAV